MCDDNRFIYNPFPPVSVGGPSGDYVVRCPVNSNEYAEFCIVTACVVGVNAGTFQVSGYDRPRALDLSGTSSYGNFGAMAGGVTGGDTTFIRSIFIQVPANWTIPFAEVWHQIAASQGIVYIRLDTSTFGMITIKQRVKILKKIPAPFLTVPPEQQQEYHSERERLIQEAVLAEEGERLVYGQGTGRQGTVRQLQRGGLGNLSNENNLLSGQRRRGS